MDAYDVGVAALQLGAGRLRKEDEIDPRVGYVLAAGIGDVVAANDPIGFVHAADEAGAQRAAAALLGACKFGAPDAAVECLPLWIDTVHGRNAPADA